MPRTPGYATRQRSLVLECLKAHAGQYLSVADIAADLTKKGSPVGVTTIYRALEKLASEGTVRRFVPDRTSPAVFEYLENPAQAEFHVRCKLDNNPAADCDGIVCLNALDWLMGR